jgi:hypothetical protein
MRTLASRVVTNLPLARLWDEQAFLPHARQRALYEEDAAAHVRDGTARLVIAELGEPLRWLPGGQARAFWTHEAEPRLIPPGTPLVGGGYGYTASLWATEDARPVLLLEVQGGHDET